MLGCSGSLAGPDSPASGYFLRGSQQENLLVDIGPGVLRAMQNAPEIEPSHCHLVLSHMHADHCLDFPSLLVWRRFHPTARATRMHTLLGPSIAETHLSHAGADFPDKPDNFRDTFDILTYRTGEGEFDPATWPAQRVGDYQVYAAPAVHTTEAYLTRFHDAQGKSFVYTGDTAYGAHIGAFARGADLLLCEAAWGPSSVGHPPGMHMSGEEAGKVAQEIQVKTLVLTHIPPWGDKQATLDAARSQFSGEIILAQPGMTIRV